MPVTDSILITYVCAVLLATVIVALVASKNFRSALISGKGEATIFGVISARGGVVVIICALLIGGMLMPFTSLINSTTTSRLARSVVDLERRVGVLESGTGEIRLALEHGAAPASKVFGDLTLSVGIDNFWRNESSVSLALIGTVAGQSTRVVTEPRSVNEFIEERMPNHIITIRILEIRPPRAHILLSVVTQEP